MLQYILSYLNTLGKTKQFPVQISEFVHINEEVIHNLLCFQWIILKLFTLESNTKSSQYTYMYTYIHTYTALCRSFYNCLCSSIRCCLSKAYFHQLLKCFEFRHVLFDVSYRRLCNICSILPRYDSIWWSRINRLDNLQLFVNCQCYLSSFSLLFIFFALH